MQNPDVWDGGDTARVEQKSPPHTHIFKMWKQRTQW